MSEEGSSGIHESFGNEGRKDLSRRRFLAVAPPALAGVLAANTPLAKAATRFSILQPVDGGVNPLSNYPNRGWETVYRDLYTPDSTYHWMCGPNDTHGCLLKGNVKNGIVVYADPSFGYGKAKDLYGNQVSSRWDPRACVSGLAYVRRAYSDRRVKGAFIRTGFKRWVDDGLPREDNGMPPLEYREGRGKEEFVKITHAEAAAIQAKVYKDIAETYSGEDGAKKLEEQGYDEAMVESMHKAGTQVLKFRGGMPFNAPFRVGGFYRYANMLALLDKHVRGVPDSDAQGGRHWDSYAWHTDLPPGHPMVTGQQTLDFDLFTAENSELITLWGMNWIATKMPEGHWISEARLKGTKVVTIAPEYQSSTTKADRALIIRPGADGALALGLAHVIVRDHKYDVDFVKKHTDLALLVRADNKKLLKGSDIIAGYTNAQLTSITVVPDDSGAPPPPAQQGTQIVKQSLRDSWGDSVVWDSVTNGPHVVNRDQTGVNFPAAVDPALEGSFEVTLTDGTKVSVRPVFDAVKQHLMDSCTPEQISAVSWVPIDAIEELAADIAAHPTKTLFVEGMGPNHFFNNDNKDRAILLVAALTNNIGHYGGTVGCYSGNYRLSNFSGIGQWTYEDPFNIQLDETKKATQNKRLHGESAHFYDYGDRPLRIGNKLFTGKTHMPAPTKSMHFANSNSLLGNAKGAHQLFVNVLPKIEMIAHNDWYWTASCEYADIVYGVDSWPERQLPDVFASISNPFLHAWPSTPLPRIYDTLDDMQVNAMIAQAFTDLTGDQRFADYWHFVSEGRPGVYIQRVFDTGNTTKGYSFDELHESSKNGTPFLMMMRTTPKVGGWEQTNESQPWWTKSGRLEFYRDEAEFIEYGENMPLHREPVDGTIHEPFVLMAKPHPLIDPVPPEAYGIDPDPRDVENRQVRNVVRTPFEIAQSAHPLVPDGFSHVMITPKYRHACHSMGASVDTEILIFGPFGDFYRHDKRKPWVAEGYVDMNPDDAAEMGIADGDYIWVDADPSDRPFVGWQDKPEDYKVFRWLVRARVNPSLVRRVARAWFHFHVATHGSVEGHEERPDGLAKNPRTGYQAGYRYGSHQSVTRAWLRTTLQTDTLARKDAAGQTINTGFELDVYGVAGAPKESFVKITKAEDGGEDTHGLWYPAAQGFRPGSENDAMRSFLAGDYISTKDGSNA